MSYAGAQNPYVLGRPKRARSGGPKRDETADDALTWREILSANADFPGAFLRFLRRVGIPSDRSMG